MATEAFPNAGGIIGAAVPRIDGPLKTSGTARYAVDHDFPGLVHAVAVQSTIGSGRITSLDASAAEKIPGVLLVLHHGNLENVYRFFPHEEDGTISEARPPFADNTIYYWGQFVALVVAETLEQATAGAHAVRVEYEATTPDVRTDLGAGFTGKRESSWKRGDPDQALSTAPVVVDETYTTPVETHNPMEMHGTVAVWEGDNLTLYECSQGVVNHRAVMAEVLGVPHENVRVISRFIGSGFGGKLFPWSQSTLAAAAARQLKRPVKLSVDPPHDVLQRGSPPAHPAAHPPGRDTGWQAHRDSPRLSKRDFAERRLHGTLRRADAVSLQLSESRSDRGHGAPQCGSACSDARTRRGARPVCAGVGDGRTGHQAEDGSGGIALEKRCRRATKARTSLSLRAT